MKKFRIAAVMLVAALAITLAGESALGLPPQAKGKALENIPTKALTKAQAGLDKATAGASNGKVPDQGKPGLTKAAAGSTNGKGGKCGKGGK